MYARMHACMHVCTQVRGEVGELKHSMRKVLELMATMVAGRPDNGVESGRRRASGGAAEHAGGESLGGCMHGERLADTGGGKGGEKGGGWVAQARDLPPPTPGSNRWSFSSLLDA